MRAARTRSATERLALIWLAAVALLIRSLVPSGYMLAPGHSDHAWPVVLCDGFGPAAPPAPLVHPDAHHEAAEHQASASHHEGHDEAPSPGHKREQPCAFSGLGTSVTPPDASLPISLILTSAATVLLPAPTIGVGRGLAAPPPPPTGPPLRL